MIQDHKVMTLADAYGGSRVTQALIKLISCVGTYVDMKIQDAISNYTAKRFRVFFDEISNGTIKLNPEIINNDDFLFCYFKTLNAVQKSRRNEKIRYLARLLKDSLGDSKIRDADEYEELLSIIEDLSFNELRIMTILATFEREFPAKNDETDVQRTKHYWESFIVTASSELSMPQTLVQPMLVRLQRSGCYQEFVGTYFNYVGGQGCLTPLYYRLEEIAGDFSKLCE